MLSRHNDSSSHVVDGATRGRWNFATVQRNHIAIFQALKLLECRIWSGKAILLPFGRISFFPDASNLSVPAGMCLVYGKFYNHIQQDGWNHWLLRQTIIPRGGAGTNLKCPFCKLKLLCAVLVRWHLVPAAAAATVAARWEMRICIHAQPVSRQCLFCFKIITRAKIIKFIHPSLILHWAVVMKLMRCLAAAGWLA